MQVDDTALHLLNTSRPWMAGMTRYQRPAVPGSLVAAPFPQLPEAVLGERASFAGFGELTA